MNDTRNQQDIYLVKRTLSGDDEAFSRLVDCYKNGVFRLVYHKIPFKGDVEDLAQEVFLRVYKSLKRFDQNRKFSTWLYTIANNLCIDYLRRKRLQSVSLDAPLFPTNGEKEVKLEIPDETNDPELVFQRTSEQIMVLKAIEKLPEQYSLVIKLRHIKGYSYEEIAQILDMPLGTIKSRIYRARNELRKILQKGGREDGLSSCV